MDLLQLLPTAQRVMKHYDITFLTPNEWMTLIQYGSIKSLKKGENFITANQVNTKIAFILKGGFRFFYEKNDNEITCLLGFENNLIGSFESNILKQPCTQTIQAIEESELFVIDYKDLEKLYDKSPKFERVGRIILEYYLAYLQQRVTSYLLDTPEQRYVRLINETPNLLNRVPLQYIASYIGVTPVSLSRIRKRILKK
ncbi:MAG TPA: Crp/Fnr family transcriptional regulator [Chitinophagales bacterium]|jgi:CRP-like cAMP-binding protein|nr:Crp/Fnr family transcriptional regulator [Chitinophagales bacterium]HQG38254.1 Crp/Fnr family transcriptional regulator [Chitinophagales bacterium]